MVLKNRVSIEVFLLVSKLFKFKIQCQKHNKNTLINFEIKYFQKESMARKR